MKRIFGGLLTLTLLLSSAFVTVFADDSSTLLSRLENLKIGETHFDINFDNNSLTGTVGTATEVLPEGAESSYRDGAYQVSNTAAGQPKLNFTPGSAIKGVIVFEMTATFDSNNTTNKFDAHRYVKIKRTSGSVTEEVTLIQWDWVNSYAYFKPFGVTVTENNAIQNEKINPSEKHTYKTVVDTVNGEALFYIDDKLVYSDTSHIAKGTTVSNYAIWAGAKANVVDTFDDVKMYMLVEPKITGISRADAYGDVHAGTDVLFNVDAEIGDGVLSYYVNGAKKGVVENNTFTCTMQSGRNDVYVQLDGTNIKSDTVSVNGIGASVEKTYHDVDFSSDDLGGLETQWPETGVTGSVVDGAYNILVNVDVTAPNQPYLAFKDASTDGAGIYMWEFDANFNNTSSTDKFAARQLRVRYNGSEQSLLKWDSGYSGYAPLYIGSVKKDNIYANTTHKYKVIADTVSGLLWVYVDNAIVYYDNTTINAGSTIGVSKIVSGKKAYDSDTFDNIKFCKLSAAVNENTYTYTSGEKEVKAISEITASSALNVKATIYKDNVSTENGDDIAFITIIKNEDEENLVAAAIQGFKFTDGQDSVVIDTSLAADVIPSDIATGNYKIYHFIWGWGDNNKLVPLAGRVTAFE